MSDLLPSLKTRLANKLTGYTFHLAVMPDTPVECVVLAEIPGPPVTMTTTGAEHQVEYFQVRVRGTTFSGVETVMGAVCAELAAIRNETLGGHWCEALDPRGPGVTIPGAKAGQFLRVRQFAAYRV